jgi:DNA-binding response OmpR family regulator
MNDSRGVILIVEDEPHVAEPLRDRLKHEGYAVEIAVDGIAGLNAARKLHPSAIIMDIGLPGMDGKDVVMQLRSEGNWTPVLFLTARDDSFDRIHGLEIGGDDYIVKTVGPREVVARIKSVLRRTSGLPKGSGVVVVGDVELDSDTRKVHIRGDEVILTTKEFDLLAHLMSKPGRVFTRDELLSHVWGYSSIVTSRTVDVHVAQLRAKLGEPDPIRTSRGVGYAIDKVDRD